MTDDFSNRKLRALTVLSLGLASALAAVGAVTDAPWSRPGSAVLQGAAIVGALLLVLSALFAGVKRLGAPARRYFALHIWLACAGFVLVSAHSVGQLLAPPALLLLAVLALMGLGLWARTSGARHMAATFGRKGGALAAYDPALRAQLAAVIDAKRRLLARIDARASEARFSLLPRHWLASPLAALDYHRLAQQERALLGTDQSVNPQQAWWRRVHRLIAVLFVIGLLVHVILVTFFAAYVAEGREVYWWHLAALDF